MVLLGFVMRHAGFISEVLNVLISSYLRRKKKAVHKTTTTDDKRLQNTLKRLGVNTIPGIEEVNIFKDETVIHFVNPKVQASLAANTCVVSGPSQTKKLEELLPSIINQLGPDNLVALRKIDQQYQSQAAAGTRMFLTL
jgi:nascent polypeptide-associated complex subunit beta